MSGATVILRSSVPVAPVRVAVRGRRIRAGFTPGVESVAVPAGADCARSGPAAARLHFHLFTSAPRTRVIAVTLREPPGALVPNSCTGNTTPFAVPAMV